MSKMLLYGAAAFLAFAPTSFSDVAMAASDHADAESACASAGMQPGNLDFTDCVRTLEQFGPTQSGYSSYDAPATLRFIAYVGPNALRFMDYAGPSLTSDAVIDPVVYTGGQSSADVACAGFGLPMGSAAYRQCVGNLSAATWQDDLASHG